MTIVKFNATTTTTTATVETDGTFLGLVEAIADEWNREDWREVIDACRKVSQGGTAHEFEAKWGVTFERR